MSGFLIHHLVSHGFSILPKLLMIFLTTNESSLIKSTYWLFLIYDLSTIFFLIFLIVKVRKNSAITFLNGFNVAFYKKLLIYLVIIYVISTGLALFLNFYVISNVSLFESDIKNYYDEEINIYIEAVDSILKMLRRILFLVLFILLLGKVRD